MCLRISLYHLKFFFVIPRNRHCNEAQHFLCVHYLNSQLVWQLNNTPPPQKKMFSSHFDKFANFKYWRINIERVCFTVGDNNLLAADDYLLILMYPPPQTLNTDTAGNIQKSRVLNLKFSLLWTQHCRNVFQKS